MVAFVPQIHDWNQPMWERLVAEQARSNHALLFCGPTGLGKLDAAFALAHHLITANHPQSLSLFNAASHPDFHVVMPEDKMLSLVDLEADANQSVDIRVEFAKRYLEQHNAKPRRAITIDQVRKLTAALTTHPHISSQRVILIGWADTLNRNAANALLKNLEEPPANTIFIVVTAEISKLPQTVRSRCSLIHFRTPEGATAKAWLEQQGELPSHEVANHLAMANNQPLLALKLYRNGYISTLKSVFNDVNGLWNARRQPLEVAKTWQELGGLECVEILQKLCVDLLRSKLSKEPPVVFFPVQQTWVQSVCNKLSSKKLVAAIDSLAEAKRLLGTTVDELLVLETLSAEMRLLPRC